MATHSNNTHTEQRPPSPTLVARSSMESSSATKLTMGRSDSLSQGDQDVEVASNTFDENAIRVLLEMDVREFFAYYPWLAKYNTVRS